jgi:hypothetical protein
MISGGDDDRIKADRLSSVFGDEPIDLVSEARGLDLADVDLRHALQVAAEGSDDDEHDADEEEGRSHCYCLLFIDFLFENGN